MKPVTGVYSHLPLALSWDPFALSLFCLVDFKQGCSLVISHGVGERAARSLDRVSRRRGARSSSRRCLENNYSPILKDKYCHWSYN